MPKPKLIAAILSLAILFSALIMTLSSCKDRVDPPYPQGGEELFLNVLTRSHGADNSINKDKEDKEDKVELGTLKTYPSVQGLRFVAEPGPEDVKVKIDQPGHFLAEKDVFSISAGVIHDLKSDTDKSVDPDKVQSLSHGSSIKLSKSMFQENDQSLRAGVFAPPFIMQAIYDKLTITPGTPGTSAQMKYKKHNSSSSTADQHDDKVLLSRFCAKVIVTIQKESNEDRILSPKVDASNEIIAKLKGIPSSIPFEIPLPDNAQLGDTFSVDTHLPALDTEFKTTKVFYLPPTVQADSTKATRLSFMVMNKSGIEKEVEVVLTDPVKDSNPLLYKPLESNNKYIVNIKLGEAYNPKVTIDVVPWNMLPTSFYTLNSSVLPVERNIVPLDLIAPVNILVPFTDLVSAVSNHTWSHLYYTSYFAERDEFMGRKYNMPHEKPWNRDGYHPPLHNTFLCPPGFHQMSIREAAASFLPFIKGQDGKFDYPSFNASGTSKTMTFGGDLYHRFGPYLLRENVANPSVSNFYTKDATCIYAIRYVGTQVRRFGEDKWSDWGNKLRTFVKYEIIPIDVNEDKVRIDNTRKDDYRNHGVSLNGFNWLENDSQYSHSKPIGICFVKNYATQYLLRITYRWVGDDAFPEVTSAKELADKDQEYSDLLKIGTTGVSYKESMMTGLYNPGPNNVSGMMEYIAYYVFGDKEEDGREPYIYHMGISRQTETLKSMYSSQDYNNLPLPKDNLTNTLGEDVDKAEVFVFRPTKSPEKYRVPVRCVRDLRVYKIY